MVKKLRIENCNLDDINKIEDDNICRLSKFNMIFAIILYYFFKNFKKIYILWLKNSE